MRLTLSGICFVAVLAGLIGCQQPAAQPLTGPMEQKPQVYEDIIWLSMTVQLPYLDEDNDQNPDGLMVDVMLNRPNVKAFVAGRGTLIFHLIQRSKVPNKVLMDKELYKWNVSDSDLQKSITRQRFGLICHHFALYWHGIPQPKGNGLYLQAEFIRTDKRRVVSRLVPIFIPDNK